MVCTFYYARPGSNCVPWLAQDRATQTSDAAKSTTISPAPLTTTGFCKRLATFAQPTTTVGSDDTVPNTTTAFVKNQPYSVEVYLAEVAELNMSWSSHTSTNEAAFSPALPTAALEDITYETTQRQLERIRAIEPCDGNKTYGRAPLTLDQPGPPKDMGQWQKSYGNGGAYGQVRVQGSTPDFMRAPSASELPPPHWSPEPIRGGHNDRYEKDFVPELMYAPSPSILPAPNWGDDLDWFADFPAPISPISSGSSASSISLYNGHIASPRPRRRQEIYDAELVQLEAEAAMMVAEQEAVARKMQAVRESIEDRVQRERTQEALRGEGARRRLRALAIRGNGPECNASTAVWVERQEESAWHFGPVRRPRRA